MDIDAVLARKPAVALVDELAHTNVPGSRNEKRWQDVEELLEAGINVLSSLNIQHLESLNDVVERITSIQQGETIPDEVVRRADELQLVDLTPLALRNRLARGDVYPPERIDAALANYFRPGNLSALRELALLWLADRVDEGLAEYRERHGIDRPWETRERVLVALTGSSDGERLVRRAARIAQRLKGDLVAVHVRPQDGLAAPSAALLEQQRDLVEEFGGTYHEVVGGDAGEALVEAARSLNATQIVMGASRRSRWSRLTHGSVIGEVIRRSGVGLDVHVISHAEGTEDHQLAFPETRRPAALPRRRLFIGLALAAARPAGPRGRPRPASRRDRPAERAPPLPAARRRHLRGGRPLARARRGDHRLPARQLVLHAAALHVHDLRRREHPRARRLPRGRRHGQLVRRPRRTPCSRCGARANRSRGSLTPCRLGARVDGARQPAQGAGAGGRVGAASPGDRAGESKRRAATEHPKAPTLRRRRLELDRDHVLALAGGPIRSEDQRVLDAFAKELAASVELGELEAEVEAAGVLSAANELRAAILSAVSHDLRTPLAGIKASVTSLLQEDVDWTPEARREFLVTIAEETDRLNALVGNLLDMSRLQTDALEIMPSRVGWKRCFRPPCTASRSPTTPSSSTCPRRFRASSPTRASSSARSRT